MSTVCQPVENFEIYMELLYSMIVRSHRRFVWWDWLIFIFYFPTLYPVLRDPHVIFCEHWTHFIKYVYDTSVVDASILLTRFFRNHENWPYKCFNKKSCKTTHPCTTVSSKLVRGTPKGDTLTTRSTSITAASKSRNVNLAHFEIWL